MNDIRDQIRDQETIRHVSDTALWVAAYRAQESERPDAAFRDPLGARLVGERGRALGRSMPASELMHWIIVLRTVAIDRLVLSAIASGVDTIINLGAGFDTRPYRLTLPPDLRWIEVDFPDVVEHKDATLSDAAPTCRLTRVAFDLQDRAARREAFLRLTETSRCALVLTEGLVLYLSPGEAASLAEDLESVPALRFWVQDYYDTSGRQRWLRVFKERLQSAPFRFEVPSWTDFFSRRGWGTHERILFVEGARRLGRKWPLPLREKIGFLLMRPEARRRMRERMGYVTFEAPRFYRGANGGAPLTR